MLTPFCFQDKDHTQPVYKRAELSQSVLKGRELAQSALRGREVTQPAFHKRELTQPLLRGRELTQPLLRGRKRRRKLRIRPEDRYKFYHLNQLRRYMLVKNKLGEDQGDSPPVGEVITGK